VAHEHVLGGSHTVAAADAAAAAAGEEAATAQGRADIAFHVIQRISNHRFLS
jgi:hypothetical protein